MGAISTKFALYIYCGFPIMCMWIGVCLHQFVTLFMPCLFYFSSDGFAIHTYGDHGQDLAHLINHFKNMSINQILNQPNSICHFKIISFLCRNIMWIKKFNIFKQNCNPSNVVFYLSKKITVVKRVKIFRYFLV